MAKPLATVTTESQLTMMAVYFPVFWSLGHLQLSLANVLLPPHRETSARWTIWSVECVWRRVCKECNTRCVCWGGGGHELQLADFTWHHGPATAFVCETQWDPVSHLSFSFSVLKHTGHQPHVSFCMCYKIILQIHALSINANHFYAWLTFAGFWQWKIHWLYTGVWPQTTTFVVQHQTESRGCALAPKAIELTQLCVLSG